MSINADTYDEPAAEPDGQDGSLAAARLLEKTAHETDRWRSEAREESAAIVADARKEAAALVQAARDEASRVREETTRLEQVASDNRERLRQHLTDMLAQVDDSAPDSGQ